jgi:hypothetical protein
MPDSKLPFLPPMPLNRWTLGQRGRYYDLNAWPVGSVDENEWLALRNRIYELEHSLLYQASKSQAKKSNDQSHLTAADIVEFIQEGIAGMAVESQTGSHVKIPVNMYMTPVQWIETFENKLGTVQESERPVRRLEFSEEHCFAVFPFQVPIVAKNGVLMVSTIVRIGMFRRVTPLIHPRSMVRSGA